MKNSPVNCCLMISRKKIYGFEGIEAEQFIAVSFS